MSKFGSLRARNTYCIIPRKYGDKWYWFKKLRVHQESKFDFHYCSEKWVTYKVVDCKTYKSIKL